jgi:DNA-binding response OmpR family regulator
MAVAERGTATKRVLIVDDEPQVAETLAEHLGDRYAVEVVADGTAALGAVTRTRPDVVLLDMNMPGLTGLEVLRRLQAIDAAIPVIMITATEDTSAVAEALRSGAFSYIPKPFSGKYVHHLVAAALEVARPPR